ncbi:MAG: JAB domain-containing protein [Bacteroidetes bacterium]|nr:MAG: JAB domain-containing protein [Bacteroidota bacterium]
MPASDALEPIRPAGEPEIRYQVPIHQWDASDRPREKLMRRGAEALTDAELIALIFGTGTRTKDGPLSAVQLGQALLRAYRSLYHLSRRDLKELMRVVGVGPAKAVQLVAAFEIGRRVESQRGGERVQVRTPADVAAVYGPLLRDLKREVFKIVLLNTANVIIGDETVSEGGLAASIVEPRAVFRRAILENAAAVICLHNHPSGNPEPSREDIRVTRQLVEAGRLMGIPVHDHLIIAGTQYTSLAERGLL